MLAGLTTPPDLVVDRYYRGAIVMAGGQTFALPEAAIALIEQARDAGLDRRVDEPRSEDHELVAALLARSLLVRTAG